MRATVDWLGCATFRLVLGGGHAAHGPETVVFLDAYVDRVPGAPSTGISTDDIDRADWIVVGHSHFDHLWGAERIARRTGATIIGSYETVRVMADQGIARDQLLPVAGGERVRLADDVVVHVFPSQHSCVWSHRQMADADEVCLGDLGLTYQEQMERFAGLGEWLASLSPEVLEHLRASNQHALGDGGALVYLFDTPAGSLLYQDTSGCWTRVLGSLRPDVAILAAAGRGNLDGEPIQGSLAQFVAQQAALLGAPGRVLLSHHDDWLPGFSTAIDTAPIRDALARAAPRSRLVEVGYLGADPVFE